MPEGKASSAARGSERKKAEEQIYGSVTSEFIEYSQHGRCSEAVCDDTKRKTTRA
jgi:hypothetical protein